MLLRERDEEEINVAFIGIAGHVQREVRQVLQRRDHIGGVAECCAWWHQAAGVYLLLSLTRTGKILISAKKKIKCTSATKVGSFPSPLELPTQK